MPVLNEARTLYATLSRLRLSRDEELVVVDGGSIDESVSIAREFTDKVFVTETGRARVMNYGAERATGEILLFLHADCQLPQRAFRIIRTALGNNGVAAGATAQGTIALSVFCEVHVTNRNVFALDVLPNIEFCPVKHWVNTDVCFPFCL